MTIVLAVFRNGKAIETKDEEILEFLGSIWYVCLNNSFQKIHIGKKICENTCNIVWKLKICVWNYLPNGPLNFSSEKTKKGTHAVL